MKTEGNAVAEQDSRAHRRELAQRLRQSKKALGEAVVVAGFDGFVDEIISVVDCRENTGQWRPVPTIAAFAEHVRASAGRSSLREIVVHRKEAGGCAVNMGDGLAGLGVQLDCYATLGSPRDTAFDDFAAKCRHVESWGQEPGRTLALEFQDGKLMLSAVEPLRGFAVPLLMDVLPRSRFARSCGEARLIALTDWTLYPKMTDCWQYLQQHVLPEVRQRPWIFVDLVDPASRSLEDKLAMLTTLTGFEPAGPTVLGLNGNEANQVATLLGLAPTDEAPGSIAALASAIRARLNLTQVVIHLPRRAAAADRDGAVSLEGPYCLNPMKSTGAGDRFNAGYATGLLLNGSLADCLTLGCACAGFFVRHGRSGSLAELAAQLEAWE